MQCVDYMHFVSGNKNHKNIVQQKSDCIHWSARTNKILIYNLCNWETLYPNHESIHVEDTNTIIEIFLVSMSLQNVFKMTLTINYYKPSLLQKKVL